MNVHICISQEESFISLEENGKVRARISLEERNNLSQLLLLSIEKMLNENELSLSDIEEFSFHSDLSESYTTYRIGKTVADSLNWAKKL